MEGKVILLNCKNIIVEIIITWQLSTNAKILSVAGSFNHPEQINLVTEVAKVVYACLKWVSHVILQSLG